MRHQNTRAMLVSLQHNTFSTFALATTCILPNDRPKRQPYVVLVFCGCIFYCVLLTRMHTHRCHSGCCYFLWILGGNLSWSMYPAAQS